MSDAYEHVRRFPLNVVLASLGFETFKYRKAGTEGYGACPIHGSKKNTTCFSFDDSGKFFCFSCGAKGKGAIDLVMAIRKCGFQQAVKYLEAFRELPTARALDQEQSERPQPAPETPSENSPFQSTYEKFKVESPWLTARGLTPATLERFEVFQYNNPARRSAYNGSVMLKIRRWSDGECVGYLSRNIGEVTQERPKYVFPKGLSKGLEVFGAWQIKNSGQKLPLRVVYLVESPFCVLKFHQLGLPAVSPFGFSVSTEQLAILAQIAKGVCYLPDQDKSQAVAGFVQQLSRVCWIRNPELPAGCDDPEQLSLDEIRSLTGSA